MSFSDNFKISSNTKLRIPQREGWNAIREHFQDLEAARFVSLVLPVGCGKSGLIAITPFAVKANRVLVIAPGLTIRGQLARDMKSSSSSNFYLKCGVFESGTALPETVEVSSGTVNTDDLNHADIVVANIQQVSGDENQWLDQFSDDFFDLILVDEAHHNTAVSWQQVFDRYPKANVINFSATPTRSDGQLMEGSIIYSFSVLEAIRLGYVKRLNAKMLSPDELVYIDSSSGEERKIGVQEVRELGESNAEFRRGIVMSNETLDSMVSYSIQELEKLRTETGENRLKIIASGINQNHCIQINEAFSRAGLRSDYVHSNLKSDNEPVLQKLENHELDVIVQARMLGEGFDHKYLSVAMVGNIYSSLSPFVQFVGRIMRVVEQNDPESKLNKGVVVFHVGANVADRWSDFREFSKGDQGYFSELLPEPDAVQFNSDGTADREANAFFGAVEPVDVVAESGVVAQDLDSIGDPSIQAALAELAAKGVTPEQAAEGVRKLQPTRQDQRLAKKTALSNSVKLETSKLLQSLSKSPAGKTLDESYVKTDYQWVISELNRRTNAHVGQSSGNRSDFTLDELEIALGVVPDLANQLTAELENG